MRAGFEGSYFALPKGCTHAQRRATGKSFTQAFQSRDYQHAYEVLAAMQSRCARFLEWIEQDRLHNDLALTLHHLDRDADCLKELAQTLAASVSDEQGLAERIIGAPSDLESYRPVARATWHNQRLCHSGNAKGL
jgi:hypothetical protein